MKFEITAYDLAIHIKNCVKELRNKYNLEVYPHSEGLDKASLVIYDHDLNRYVKEVDVIKDSTASKSKIYRCYTMENAMIHAILYLRKKKLDPKFKKKEMKK